MCIKHMHATAGPLTDAKYVSQWVLPVSCWCFVESVSGLVLDCDAAMAR